MTHDTDPNAGGPAGAGASHAARAPAQGGRAAEAVVQRRLLLVVRATFAILLLTFTFLGVFVANTIWKETGQQVWWVPVLAAVIFGVLAVGADLVTPVKKISTVTGVLMGMLAGLLATLALSGLLDLMLQSWIPEKALEWVQPLTTTIKVLMGICFCYLGVITVLQTQDDFRLVIPYVEFAKQIRGPRPLLIDSSALIDGRLPDIAATGFIQHPLVIPRFVLGELQTLADSDDPLRRARGKRGLDVAARLQKMATADVSIDETPVPGKAVDQLLIELARVMPAVVMTTDANLARVAGIQGVPVLNLHDLANATRLNLVPGEPVTLRLIRAGEQAGQAVGYLADGTMIVAEDGAGHIGQTVTMTVVSSLQTSGGRLIFARLGEVSAHAQRGGEGQRGGEPQRGGEAQRGVQAERDASDAGEPDGDPAASSPAPTADAGPIDGGPSSDVGGGRPRGGPPSRGAGQRAGTPRNPRR